MIFTKLNKEEYNKFAASKDDSLFFQSSYWGEIKKYNGWTYDFVGIKENNKIIAASLILFKKVKNLNKSIAYSPRGYIMDYSNEKLLSFMTENIKKYLKTKKAIFLKINPYIEYKKHDINGGCISDENAELMNIFKKNKYKHNGFYTENDKKNDIEPRWLSVLNLKNKTTDEILKNMRATTRNQIKVSQKNCLKIIDANEKNIAEFKELMQHTANRREFVDRPLSYYQNMYSILNKEKLIKILLVEIDFEKQLDKTKDEQKKLTEKINNIQLNSSKKSQLNELKKQLLSIEKNINELKETIKENGNKKIIAAGLYMLYGKQLVYLFGASYKQFMKYKSQYLLQWEMIKYAKENNYNTFNFYGIDGNFDSNYKNYGLFDFKKGFSAEVIELIGEFDLIINPMYYHLYKIIFSTIKKIKKVSYIK